MITPPRAFARRDRGERRKHRGGIAVQDLLARFLADLRFRDRLAGPVAPNSVPSVPHTMRSAPYSRTPASIARGPKELQSTYTFERRKRAEGSSSFGVSSRQRWSMRSTS